jgi:two-component system, OmpR family, response regulator
MLAPAFVTGSAEPDHIPSPEPELPPDPTLETLSRVREAATSIAARVRQALSPPGFVPMRVLVVDDHPDAADALAAVLELLGCPVRSCLDGHSALAAAKELLPEVCLIDLMMPGMDGLELASRLKAWAAGRPMLVVATTALGDEESRARTALAGFHEHLVKPVNVPTLIDALTRMGKFIVRREPAARPAPPEETTP